MYKKLLMFFFVAAAILGCADKKDTTSSDIDTAHNFIQDIQESKYEEAEKLMVNSAANQISLQQLRKAASDKTAAEMDTYKNATIIINEIEAVSDSVTIVNYAVSSNKEQKNKLKLIKNNGQWLVDLSYTFSGNL